ncbi:Uncharacterized membrane protein [Fontimonas thermophila]|uniref:Uncharacterized membrane protein n=1 Tax=Fontimonas thermophila TaxID=1076937 RepID=A0A1I2J1Y8_9GAMM|nr:DUF2061 domain-containing protein [Fontimonas thermophila]SFF48020.1 Uncharacterized membrane protein [Fontimonas thermophila]
MIKTLSFGAMHVTVAFAVVWLMTGDWMTGGAVALIEPCVNTLAYHIHEKLWKRHGAGTAAACGHALPGPHRMPGNNHQLRCL